MTISRWLDCAKRDADRRDLSALPPLLEALARATEILRAATWNRDASGQSHDPPPPHAR